MKDKKMVLQMFLLLALVPVLTLAFFSFSKNATIAYSTIPDYEISFNSTKNKFFEGTGSTEYSGEAPVKTNTGNDISFSYYSVAGGSSSNWHLIKNGGYFYNIDPIHGLKSISIECTSANKQYTISWGRDHSYDLGTTNILSSGTADVFSFENSYPTYFKFTNSSGNNISIKNMNVVLSCVNTYPVLNFSYDSNMGTVTGSGVKNANSIVTITAYPNTGYRFAGWYVDDVLLNSNASYTFTIYENDLNYTALFLPDTYSLLVLSESEDKGTTSNSSGSYDYNTDVSISATPNNGYHFSGWYENDTLISTNNPYSFAMPSSNKTYVAKFTENYYSVTLTKDNSSLGSVSGSGSFKYNNVVTITASPNTGVAFLGWYDGEILISELSSYTFIMPYENLSYVAKFAWVPHSITLTSNDESMGSVSGSGSFHYSQSVTITATSTEHNSFYGWYKGETLLSQEKSYTFSMPNESLNIEGRFVPNHSLLVYSDNDAMGTTVAPTEWGEGLMVTVSAQNNPGYIFDYWANGDYDEVSYTSNYSFIMPNHDVELIAVYVVGYYLNVTSSDTSKGTVTGNGYYRPGVEVTATMTYHSGLFNGWYDSNNNFVTRENPYTFIMPDYDYSLTASFMTDSQETTWNKNHGVTPVKTNKKVTYGIYPQDNVNDNASLVSALNSLTLQEVNGWYYYNGDYYTFVDGTSTNAGAPFKNGISINKGTKYWFKCQPISWQILSSSSGNYYLLSEYVLNSSIYYNSYDPRTISGSTVYPNNYKHSDIRNWLNTTFYECAFALDDSHVVTTTVDNSASSSIYSSDYYCENTNDKVFIPSYNDYYYDTYGFGSNESRQCEATDYARALRAGYVSSSDLRSMYYTRTPVSNNEQCAYTINYAGSLANGSSVRVRQGVRPAITMHL